MLELYSKISYFTGTNSINTRRISRKVVKENLLLEKLALGGGQFFIKIFIYI